MPCCSQSQDPLLQVARAEAMARREEEAHRREEQRAALTAYRDQRAAEAGRAEAAAAHKAEQQAALVWVGHVLAVVNSRVHKRQGGYIKCGLLKRGSGLQPLIFSKLLQLKHNLWHEVYTASMSAASPVSSMACSEVALTLHPGGQASRHQRRACGVSRSAAGSQACSARGAAPGAGGAARAAGGAAGCPEGTGEQTFAVSPCTRLGAVVTEYAMLWAISAAEATLPPRGCQHMQRACCMHHASSKRSSHRLR